MSFRAGQVPLEYYGRNLKFHPLMLNAELTPRERIFIYRTVRIPMTVRELSKEEKMSHIQVRRVLNSLLDKGLIKCRPRLPKEEKSN